METVSLGELTKLCYRYPTFYGFDYQAAGVLVLKGENISRDGELIEVDPPDYITKEIHARFPRTHLEAGDLVVSVRGEVGKVGLVPDHLAGSNINANTIRIALLKRARGEEFTPEFLWFYLNSGPGQLLIRQFIAGGVQETITAPELLKVRIPKLDFKTQEHLVMAMDAAQKERQAKLKEADALLAGLDDFVLETLGLKSHTPQKAVFAVRATDILSSRFDPDFHSLQFRTIRNRIEKGRYPARSLAELCEHFITGFAAGRQNQAFELQNGVPHLRPLNLDIFGQLSLEGTKLVPKESVAEGNWCVRGEVLFNNTNSTEMVGKSAVFDLEQPCACSNHVTRLRPRDGIASEYLVAVLNALRRLGYLGLLSTNFNNQAGINTETLKQLRLPQPPVREQERIAAKVCRYRAEARRLRAEAEAGWQAAKLWFEEQLLGHSTP